ncbi:MAG TPA: NADH dehydrogenase subunit [Microscillaceae bacterium]|nr:NADH dehydrogenase subunit [Microscillaceae bacterium]
MDTRISPNASFHTDAVKLTLLQSSGAVPLEAIPVLDYADFYDLLVERLANPECHCLTYYGFPWRNEIRCLACIADDTHHTVEVYAYALPKSDNLRLEAISEKIPAMHIFERELAENFGIDFFGHPWLKPVRLAWNRSDLSQTLRNYPFYAIDSESLHEVGVGPIHAGVIEPGHFRFICNGEEILHLEIQLGYQHRGVEHLFVQHKKLTQRTVLAESIAGDTAVGHTWAFAQVMEALMHLQPDETTELNRTLALELERMAIHTGDMSALFVDVAYQLGSAVLGVLRTPLINFFQQWCGNRFAKGLVRVGYSPYPLQPALAEQLDKMLIAYKARYLQMMEHALSLPSVQARFEKNGEVSLAQMQTIGAVGMAARMAGLARDIRISHPFGNFRQSPIATHLKEGGDVWARAHLRHDEILTSMQYLRDHLPKLQPAVQNIPTSYPALPAEHFALALTEGWRGEICHCAVTDQHGEIAHYKVKDPSMHNWLALALACRNLDISDFPVNNKSFNLSYCGFDL